MTSQPNPNVFQAGPLPPTEARQHAVLAVMRALDVVMNGVRTQLAIDAFRPDALTALLSAGYIRHNAETDRYEVVCDGTQ